MTQFNIKEALEILKISKATFYRDMKHGKVSYSYDKKHNRTVDLSELIRVYGEENIQIKNLSTKNLIHDKTDKLSSINNQYNIDIKNKNQEIEHLKQILEEKNLRISDLNRTIELLENNLNKANLILENLSIDKNIHENKPIKKSKWKFWKK